MSQVRRQRQAYLFKDPSDPSDPSISLSSPLTRRPPLFTPRVPTSGVLRYTNIKRRSSGYQSTPPPPFFLSPDIRFQDRRRTFFTYFFKYFSISIFISNPNRLEH